MVAARFRAQSYTTPWQTKPFHDRGLSINDSWWAKFNGFVDEWMSPTTVSVVSLVKSLLLACCWALLVSVLILLAFRHGGNLQVRTMVALLLLFCVSMLLRLGLATWGPGDLNVNILRSQYGAAPGLLVRAVAEVFGLSPRTPVIVSLVTGSLAPVALVLTAEALGRDRATAFAAGLLLALAPYAIRTSGEGERQSCAILLSILSIGGLSVWILKAEVLGGVCFLAAGLLCAASRPELVLILPVTGLLIPFLARSRTELFRGILSVLVLTVIVVIIFPWSREVWVMADGNGIWKLPGPWTAIWMSPEYTSWAVLVLTAIGLVIGAVRKDRIIIWSGLTLIALGIITSAHPIDHLRLASARYQTILLIFQAIVAGAGATWIIGLVAPLVGRRMKYAVPVLLAAALVATSIVPIRQVTARRSIDDEYAFLAGAVRQLPPSAVVYILNPDRRVEVGLRFLKDISILSAMPQQNWLELPQSKDKLVPGAYFYLQPVCSADPAHLEHDRPMVARCRAVKGCLDGEPIVDAMLSSRRFAWDQFGDESVHVAIYPVSALDACEFNDGVWSVGNDASN